MQVAEQIKEVDYNAQLNQLKETDPEKYKEAQYYIKEIFDREDPVRAIPLFMKDKSGEPFVMQQFQKEWHWHIDDNQYTLIISPRDHGKSEQIAIGRALVEIGKNPNIRLGLFSGNATMVEERSGAIKRHIESNEAYHALYPHIKPDYKDIWTKKRMSVINSKIDKSPTIVAAGIDSTITGMRLDMAILDDVVTREAISSDAYRKKIKETFENDIMNLMEPDGKIIIICTLWNKDDLYHNIMNNKDKNGFAVLFQGYKEDLSNLLWANKWTKERLEQRRSQGIIAFDRGFRNIPLSDEDALFKRWMIEQCIRIGKPEEVVGDDWRRYIGVDLAISQKETADYTILFVVAIEPNTDRKIPLEIIRGKFTSPETAKLIMKLNSKHRPNKIFVENNAYQQSLTQWIDEMKQWDVGWSNPPIEGFLTGKQKWDEYIGLPSMASEFANNSWEIWMHKNPVTDGEGGCNCAYCAFVDELLYFPIGKHDDTIMAAWFAREAGRTDSRGSFELW